MDHIFTKLNSSVELNDPGNDQIERSASEKEEDPHRSQQEYSYPKPEKKGRNPSQLRSQPAVASSADMGSTSNKVISMLGAANGSQMILMEPHSFEELSQAIVALRERKVVVLNMTIFEPEQAQRAIDFVAGATYAIDGHPQFISEGVFLFAPSCVHVSTHVKTSLETYL